MPVQSEAERSLFDQLAALIREELDQREMTRKQLAGLMDVSAAYITQSLENDDKRYNIKPLLRMATALSLEINVIASPKNLDQEIQDVRERVNTLSSDLANIAKRLHLLAR